MRPNYGGGNENHGDLLQKVQRSHAHTAAHSAPALEPATADPLASAGDSWTLMGKSGPVSLGSLLLSPGSWCTQALFEMSEHLWWVWGLILNAISPLLPPSWGFSVLGHGVSPQSHFSAMQPPGAAHFIYVIISPGLCLFNIIPGLLSYNHCISTANQKFLEKPVT